MGEELEKRKHKQYVVERKLTAAKYKEKRYTGLQNTSQCPSSVWISGIGGIFVHMISAY